jgi:transcription factor E
VVGDTLVTRKKIVKKKVSKKNTHKKAVKRKAPKKKVIRKKPVKKKPLTKNPVKKVVSKKLIVKAEPEKIVPRKPTLEQRRELKRVLTIVGDAYVRQNLIDVGGENALAIIKTFYGHSSDEDLAKKLKIKISDVRATLNKLHNEGLVNYIRQKDSETGWYSYSWSLNHERMERWASCQTNKLDTLTDSNGGDRYFCASCGAATITNFETAANGDFRCERCNKLLEFLDEKRMVELVEKIRI